MIREVTYEGFLPTEVPHKFEGNTSHCRCFWNGLAMDFLQEIGMKTLEEHDRDISHYARELLEEIKRNSHSFPQKRYRTHFFYTSERK